MEAGTEGAPTLAPMSRRLRIALALGAGGWLVLAYGDALARYQTIHHRTFDLALYARLSWGLVRGSGWDPIGGGSFFGAHVPWVLVPLGLLGELFGTVEVLLGAQALAIALAAIALSRIAHRYAGDPGAVAALVAWLAYPNLFHVATYEFHPGTLAVWPLCEALDALDRRRPRSLVAWCALAIGCRASLALVVACIGLLALSRRASPRRTGVALVACSLAYFVLVLVVPPLLGATRGDSLDLHYGPWGGSPLGALAALFTDPGRIAAHFSEPARLAYPLVVLAPLALYPLLAPRWLIIVLPTFALNQLSVFPTSTELYSHYLTPAVPPLVVGAIEGASRVARRIPRAGAPLAWAPLVACALVASVLVGGAPWSLDRVGVDFVRDARTAERSRVLARIPAGEPVQAPDALLSHLALRRVVHRAPPPERGTQYVVLDLGHRVRFSGSEDLLRTIEEPLVRRWLERADHALVHAEPSLLVLRRGGDPRVEPGARYVVADARSDGAGVRLGACLSLLAARLDGDLLALDLRADAPCAPDLALRLGAGARPRRVDLLFDGLFSPVHLRAGDVARSVHRLSAAERALFAAGGLRVGLLRASGAPPEPSDPASIAVASAGSGPGPR